MQTGLREKKVAPWFSKAEWIDVYKKIYADDIALQNEAYERMCLWKFRCPKLPVGVECTMEILQVHLFDKKCTGSDVLHSKRDVQLMYSTTLMRFVNQITHLFRDKLHKNPTCYDIAKMYGIPDWIVNIRHEAAHKNVFPSIELLKTAADFALDWLNKNYWALDAEESEDFILEGSQITAGAEQKIKILLNLWQSCKLYKFAGYHTVGDIPNTYLRSHLFSLKEVENILNAADSNVNLETYLNTDGTSTKSAIRITDVFKFLVKYLKKLMPVNIGINNFAKNIFIKSLIRCELFLPVTYNHEFYSNGNELCGSLSLFWRDILEVYHNSYLMTDLLSELIEVSLTDEIYSRQLVAACWISHITSSLCNPSAEIKCMPSETINKTFAVSFLKNQGILDADDVVTVQSKNVLSNLNLSRNVSLNYHILENIVNKVVIKPNQSTVLYLPSLLNLLNPPLDLSAKNGILQLVEAYTSTEDCEPMSDIIYTTDMLPGFYSGVSNNSKEENHEENVFQTESIWSKHYGVYDWRSCPLGRLPVTSQSD